MPKKPPALASDQVYEMQANICKAFANPTRLRILDLCSTGEQPASAMQDLLGISPANLSQHLAILKAVGVIGTRREGKQVFCSLAIPQVKQACSLIRDVLKARITGANDLSL